MYQVAQKGRSSQTRLQRMAVRWLRDQQGVAAVEMALILPILVLMIVGMSETVDMMMVDQKVTTMTNTTADLVSRVAKIDNQGLNDVFAATQAIIQPFPTTGLSVKLTSINKNSSNQVKVHWSAATTGTTPYTKGANYTKALPTGVLGTNDFVIMAEITYSYAGPSTDFIIGPSTLTSTYYSKPRRSRSVLRCDNLSLSAPTCY